MIALSAVGFANAGLDEFSGAALEGLAPALWRPIQRAVLNRKPSGSS